MSGQASISALPGSGGTRARDAFAEAGRHLRRIIDSIADAVVVVDRDGVVKFANPAAERLFGRSRAQLLGGSFGLPLVAGETTEVDLSDGRVAEMRVVDLAWDGERAWLASLRDVTARREAERNERRLWRERAAREEAQRERDRLREEERAKDQFLAVLGHELRNPLAGIDSGLRLLEQGVGGERAGWSLAMMRKQVTVLTRLLDDLLDVAAIARGKLELERQTVPVAELVESAVAAVHGRFEARRQRLAAAPPAEPLFVDGDPRRLGQVLANLLVNASKYSGPDTEVALTARRRDGRVEIEVADQGRGIRPEMLEQVFEPFVQAGRARPGRDAPAAGGLGIGLTLVRQLVELHGGTVTASSAGPGRGSTFTVTLPAAPAAGAAETPHPATAAAAPGPSGARILVIDDNQDAAVALAELLELKGCTAGYATSGGEGLARALAAPPDVVLLDLDLPDLSGYEVAERMRADPRLEGMVIVAVSGFGHGEARQRARSAGMDHHLVKPIDLDELFEVLASHAPERGARPEAV